MTKEEEFRLKHESYYNVLTGERTYDSDTVELMLSSYAKQQAIAFATYYSKGKLFESNEGNPEYYRMGDRYDLFIEQQNKDNDK